ncbi:MAG: glycosyltransferase family 4 protein [Alphaproteobacteria bacterium]
MGHAGKAGKPGSTIIVTANSAWNLAHYRAPVIRALIGRDYRVVAAAAPDSALPELESMGVEFVPVAIDARGVSPLHDLALVLGYRRIFKRVRPCAVLTFTAKPNIYGSLAATSLGIPVVSTVTGLGTGFLSGRALQSLVSLLYRLSFRRCSKVFFHNKEDLQLFIEKGLVRPGNGGVVPGSGVDLERFLAPAGSRANPVPTFLFIGRLLKDKGVVEFIEAAGMVASRREARFQIAGTIEGHPKAVPPALIASAERSGTVEMLGTTDDIRTFIRNADCVVLPSYREGLPRALLEASAMATPVIATDAPGCRQVVEHGVTGLLCKPRSAKSLAEAMMAFAGMSPAKRAQMGRSGRAKVEREFSEEKVIEAYINSLRELGC